MSYTVLARKYRPQKFSDVIGQEHVTGTLQNAIEQQRIAHGYIFSGHRGIGKTTVARILAMALNCRSKDHPVPEPCGVCESCTEIRAGNSVDVIEIDAATNRGIDEIRELREAARYRPARDRFKIYILDEAHQITDAAFNALLKTLEEPPDHIIFMLATTQPEDIPQTIRSRCQHFSFRAVKFDAIVAQLRDLTGREGIPAEDAALAMLAEAGDGSMRDALSILDQAIASSPGALTADAIRSLVGAAPAQVLENVMQAAARGSSEEILNEVDRLLNDGHSPTHFARQMVRFLRNATVAKVAGENSSLLQISSEERARAARVAALFTEEDLTRHLQIMLRTHGELGYKQEPRFHLELGLLKMAHAQRLLPMEQLLSELSTTVPGLASTPASAGLRAPAPPPPPPRQNPVSPFAADSARKSTPRSDMSSSVSGPRLVAPASQPIILGSAAPAEAAPVSVAPIEAAPIEIPQTAPERAPEVVAPAPAPVLDTRPASTVAPASAEKVRDAVLQALLDNNQRILASMLESGQWTVDGNELAIAITASATVLDMSMGADAKRLIIASASGSLGRPAKLRVVPGSAVSQTAPAQKTAAPSNGSGRSRAEQDPVVRRMQEKFGAEIRTVIDYKERR